MITYIIIAIILVLGAVFFGILLATTGNVPKAATEFIALAEDTAQAGAVKMAQVVAQLYDSIPLVLRKVFTKERLQVLAQFLFDWMRKYAVSYWKAQQSAHPPDEMQNVSTEAVTELLSELVGMTLAAMKEKAAAYGIDVTGKDTKKAVAEAIIQHILKAPA